ncbi:MAG: Formyltetrahydrofolate deformylase [Chlamydiae bacterium]|nr:Formyltetrahydrofolate deformylase [Chlamydiota bacterium]
MGKHEFILNLVCPDRIGIVAGVTGVLAEMGLFILELSQYSDPSTGQFFMRIHFETTQEISEESIAQNFAKSAETFQMKWELHDTQYRPRVLIMVSKESHCFNDLLHRWASRKLAIEVAGVISNHQELEEMASWYKVPFHYLPITPKNKSDQEAALLEIIEREEIDLIVLARYMQILSEKVCRALDGKVINIHHSFLPSFKGAKPYHQAFERGVKVIGATAHYITADLDEGPIIDQETIRVRHDHTPEQLVQLGCDVECQVLARAVKWHIEQRVIINQHKTVVFN